MQINREKLDNGINLIHYFLPATNSVTFTIMVDVASVDELKKEAGISHFVEHLLGNRSEKFPDIDENKFYLEKLGIVRNAWTDKNATAYYVKSPTYKFKDSVEYLTDTVLNAVIDSEDITGEKGVILEEFKMGKDSLFRTCWDKLNEEIFADTNLKYPQIGTEETIKSFDKVMVNNFLDKHYHLGNMVFNVSGNVTFEEVKKILGKLKLQLKDHKKKGVREIEEVSEYKEVLFAKKDMKSYYIAHAINGFDIKDKNFELSLLASFILGEGEGSLLNKTLSIEKALISHVDTELIEFEKDGLILNFIVCTEQNVKKAVRFLKDEVENLASGNITDEDLLRAKNLLKGKFLSMEETSNSFIDTSDSFNLIRRELLSKKEIDFDEMIKRIESVSIKDISNHFSDKIRENRTVISYVGSEKLKF